MKLVGRVCRDVDGFARAYGGFSASEGSFNLAFEQDECLFEVVAVRRRATLGRNVHVDEAETASGVFAREEDRICVPDQANVRQGFVLVWARDGEGSAEIVGRDRREGLDWRGDAVCHLDLLVCSFQ